MKKRKLILLNLMVLGILLVQQVLPYSYGAWVGLTGEKTIAVNPFMSGAAEDNFSLGYDMLAEFGTGPNSDLFLSTGGWAMFRYDFSKGNNLGIVGLFADDSAGGLEYHMIVDDSDSFAFEANLYGHSAWDSSYISLGARIAPTIKLNSIINFFVEADPDYEVKSETFALGIVPGFCFNIGDSQLAIGLTTGDVLDEISYGYGVWYWMPIGY